jgi:hypothetical protein
MLITLLAWLYIGFLCWSWGRIFLSALKKINNEDQPGPPFSLICLAGLSIITVIASILSLFIPLGSWWVQLIFLIPSLMLLIRDKKEIYFSSLTKVFTGLHNTSLLLLISCLLMVLVMSTWTIVHPDTLGYHAQTIQWIEKYKAVPGLVHLHVRLGYQGLWFTDCALFGFRFTGISGITLLNSTVLFWFFVFVISRINHHFFKSENELPGFLWLALLLISCFSYTQVRLTATSASPDFIASLFVLAIVWLLLEQSNSRASNHRWMLVGFLSAVAVTTKLSVIPFLLLTVAAVLIFFRQKKLRLVIFLLFFTAVSFFPFFARNIIASGYALFPLTGSDIIKTGWKYPEPGTWQEKNYITAYAKFPGISRNADLAAAANSNPSEWLPGWWNHRSAADKIILILFIISFVAALVYVKRIFNSGKTLLFLFFTLLTGILFWFIQAPDPRFGFGQIIGFIGIVFYLLLKDKKWKITSAFCSLFLISAFAIATVYTAYRFKNFFSGSQWLKPTGIKKTDYSILNCNGMMINIPTPGKDLGNIPVPCTNQDCETFVPRGENITDGFQAKQIR